MIESLMRALGPGSVSSFLKVILDVFHFVLWAAIAILIVAIVAVLLLSFRPELLRTSRIVTVGDIHIEGAPGWARLARGTCFLAVILYLASGAIVIVGRLRRIFQTLVAGDPFHPDNVRRLRIIGGGAGKSGLKAWAVTLVSPPACPIWSSTAAITSAEA